MGARNFKEIIHDRNSIPTFVMMGVGFTWMFVSPMVKGALLSLFGL
ncbi:MAG: hypothetical protein J7L90_01650 [Dehalococcoidia bacterium]|nr:hypothetical protein [Dehalococcoidia bacterium]